MAYALIAVVLVAAGSFTDFFLGKGGIYLKVNVALLLLRSML